MLYLIAEKLPSAFNFRLPLLLKYTLNKKLANSHQLDLAIIYLKEQGKSNFSEGDFENYTGVIKFVTKRSVLNIQMRNIMRPLMKFLCLTKQKL